MQRNARYLKVLSGDPVLVQKERKNKLTTRFEPSLYTVVNKHGNSLIVQSSGGAQYSHNTSHVKKLLENGDTHDDKPSIPEVLMTGEPNKQDKPTPQQSVVIPEPNVIALSTTQEVPQTQTGPKLSQRLLYLNFRDTEISETLLTLLLVHVYVSWTNYYFVFTSAKCFPSKWGGTLCIRTQTPPQ